MTESRISPRRFDMMFEIRDLSQLASVLFPRSMLNGPANARLLEALGVEIVSDRDCELEDYARSWLVQVDGVNEPRRGHGERGSGSPAGHIATEAVRRALERIDEQRAVA